MTTRREVIALERPAPDLDQAFGGFGPGGARETKGRERRGGETAHEGLRCVGWRGRRSVAVGVGRDRDAADEAGREGAAAGLGRSRGGDKRAGEHSCSKSGGDGLAEGHDGSPVGFARTVASVLTPLLMAKAESRGCAEARDRKA